MTARHNIFAYTPPGDSYPPYLSINRETDGRVTVTVRSLSRLVLETNRAGLHQVCGDYATITVPAAQFHKLIAALALDPELWPGCDCAIKHAQAEVGKPYGGPLA